MTVAPLNLAAAPIRRADAPPGPTADAGDFDTAGRVPLLNAAAMLGVLAKGKIKCPNCNAVTTVVSDNGLHCATCSRGPFGPVALAKRVRSLDDVGAVRLLVDTFGAPDSAASRMALLDGPALALPLEPLDYLIAEIGCVAGGGAPHMIAGYGFVGKTIAIQSALLGLAAHRSVWGAYRSRRARRVMHVDLEQGERLTRRRYQRLALAMGVHLPSLGDSLACAVMPAISLTAEHEDAWRELMTNRDAIVIDSLRAATAGADENDSGIRAGLDMLGKLSESTGCRPLVIHHARKPSGDDTSGGRYSIRGSSALYDACDSVYTFSAEKGEPVLVDHVKARSHGEPTDSIALVIEDVATESDPRGALRVAVHGAELVAQRREERDEVERRTKAARDAERLWREIVKQPGVSATLLRGATSLSGERYTAALAALGDRVEVRSEQAGRTRTSRHFPRGAA